MLVQITTGLRDNQLIHLPDQLLFARHAWERLNLWDGQLMYKGGNGSAAVWVRLSPPVARRRHLKSHFLKASYSRV